MCLFLRPNVTQPITFPTNMPDEVFFFSADATMNVPGGTALLVSGVEGNTAINDDGSTSLISFARVRIRVDTSVAGDYVVTTPYKQYFFNGVPAGGKAINFTEDIGIGPEGDFAGALLGSIGPFLYSAGAPFVTATGSYVGDNTPRTVQGSTFIDPVTGQPANLFRVQGPGVNVSTTQFAVTGKIYTGDIPTPLTVDRVTYTRDASSVQVSSFATTQALSEGWRSSVSRPVCPHQYSFFAPFRRHGCS
jgi:hypothetical protein